MPTNWSKWFEGDGSWLPWLTRRQRLVTTYVVVLVLLILLYSVLYNYGMRTLEGHDHSLFRSFQTVVETMTTTGYGADAPWSSPLMNVFVVFMQLTGIGIGFATLRVLIIPLFERAPMDLSDRLTAKDDHVIVCEYRRDTGVLLDELEGLNVGYVLIESDAEQAKRLSDGGYQVIHGDPEEGAELERAMVSKASTIVTDAGDRNASIVLTALRRNDDLRVISFTDTPDHDAALREVGADVVLSPDALIGRRLGQKTTAWADTPEAMGDATVGDVRIREVLVRRNSPLAGVQIADTALATHSDLTLVGAWIDGDLRLPVDPAEVITPNSVLIVAGTEWAIDDVQEFAAGLRPPRRHDNVVVAGMSVGGQAAYEALAEDVTATTIDTEDGHRVDVVGDVRDPETLETAGIEDASALIVTVGDDSTAMLAVAIARTLTDDIEILVRVDGTAKSPTAFDAGADYVLSTQRVSARLLARELRGEDVLTPFEQLRIVRTDAAAFVGQTLGDVSTETEAGYVFVGVERDGTFVTDASTEIATDDRLVVAGTDATIREFECRYA
ncbi:TrkA family potassium uptake protein [Halorussus sp. MSC15.2]|uniref:potassium channel family protein n=1 Tax=Halorussus sp. MSC15.2 TaxID=2283638 RepID=UPI0013D45FFC|nr:NAD-binding protein [Halorussus sp. MSC15.2]NEU55684.1 TrkA family potassium uptake protein [Halorussus sp. MSC15.2]